MSCIELADITIDFPLYHGNARSLKKSVLAAARRVATDVQHRVVVQALRDISFRLNAGDRLGLIGNNGAGKTTLLRTIAGIYEPVRGRLRVEGELNALLDPNLGMNPDLTGRENIMLRGLFRGLTRARIHRLEDDVQQFAELGEFMDLPLRIYSAGMMVRLGFALATAIAPEVLLMDEWLLAGDAHFFEKAHARVENMVRGAEILILSSHQLATIARWCTRVIWLDQGTIRADGEPLEVLGTYLGRPIATPADAMVTA